MQEPPTNTALLQHPLVTSTPHLGASTVDAQTRVAVDIARQFIAFTRQTALTGAVSTVQPSVKLSSNPVRTLVYSNAQIESRTGWTTCESRLFNFISIICGILIGPILWAIEVPSVTRCRCRCCCRRRRCRGHRCARATVATPG